MQAEADIFRTLADPTRLRLLVFLQLRGETCVCELAEALAAPAFRISRHLGIMRDRGLVEARREGTWMYYRLAVPETRLEEYLHACFLDCLSEHETIKADLARLSATTCAAKADCHAR